MKKYYFIYLSIIATLYSMENDNNLINTNNNNRPDPFGDSPFHISSTRVHEAVRFNVSINPKLFRQRIDTLKKLMLNSPSFFAPHVCSLLQNAIAQNDKSDLPKSPLQTSIEKTCVNLNEGINAITPFPGDDFLETTIREMGNLIRLVERNAKSSKVLLKENYDNCQKLCNIITMYTFLDCLVKIDPHSYLAGNILYGPHLIAPRGELRYLEIFYKVSGRMPLDGHKKSAFRYISPETHSRTSNFLKSIPPPKLSDSLQTITMENLNGQPQESLGQFPQPWLANTPTQAEE